MNAYGKCEFCKEADAIYDLDGRGACMDCFGAHAYMDYERIKEENENEY